MAAVPSDVRALAFYLPQFHPTPENDEWWGPGFTEWTNAARATKLFRGHAQPHLPQELGFYDLRLPEARLKQAELAKAFGISAFLYWHYWFGAGQRLLERPFSEVLKQSDLSLGFCLGWANQTWTGVWHGAPNRILMEQKYLGPHDNQEHFDAIVDAFRDPRYFRVEGKPLFYIFRPEQIPDAKGWADQWRTMARQAGLPGLYLVAEISDLLGNGPTYTVEQGGPFDAGVYVRLPAVVNPLTRLRMRTLRKFGSPERWPYAHGQYWRGPGASTSQAKVFPSVYPNWDNTPRSGTRGLVLEGSSPKAFEAHVRRAASSLSTFVPQERLLFIKSWNEWAEGNYLEPDLEHGRDYLMALAAGLRSN